MKRILCLVLILLLASLTACTSKKEGALTGDEINEKIQNSEKQPGNDTPSVTPTPSSQKIGIYSIEDDSLDTVSVETVVEIEGELKAENVIDAVVNELEDHDIDITIASVTNEDRKVTIDISADDPFLPFGSLGSTAEGSVLDCLSYSIFDNFSDVTAVYFLVNGSAYETGHIELKVGEPYLTR